MKALPGRLGLRGHKRRRMALFRAATDIRPLVTNHLLGADRAPQRPPGARSAQRRRRRSRLPRKARPAICASLARRCIKAGRWLCFTPATRARAHSRRARVGTSQVPRRQLGWWSQLIWRVVCQVGRGDFSQFALGFDGGVVGWVGGGPGCWARRAVRLIFAGWGPQDHVRRGEPLSRIGRGRPWLLAGCS